MGEEALKLPEEAIFQKTEEYLSAYNQLCREIAMERLKYISREAWDIQEIEEWDRMVFASNLVMITVAGKDLRVFLKVHFRPKKVLNVLPGVTTSIGDFFAEYANLVAGGVKQSLLETGLICGISLPTMSSGFDEIIFSDKIRPHRFVDCFSLVRDETEVFVTISTDVLSEAVNEKILQCESNTMEAGDIEFL